MANGDHISLGAGIWNGILTFWGGLLLLLIRGLLKKIDGKADKDDMNEKLGAIKNEIAAAEDRQDSRHTENTGRLEHITERIDTLISRTKGGNLR